MLGCSVRLGTRTADGTYLTFNGEAVNAYEGPYDLTRQAGLQIISTMEITIREKRKVRDGIMILAEAPDGSPMKLQFIKEGRDLTVVKVRTGRIGYWGHEFSYQFHALMKAQLDRLIQQASAQKPHINIAPTVVSNDTHTATSAIKPPIPVESSPLTPEANKIPDKEDSKRKTAKTVVSASKESLPSEVNVSELEFTKPTATIFFDADSNLPGEEELTKLDDIILQARSNLNTKMALTGFVGESDNMDQAELLTKSRVMAVKYYLIGKGIDANQIVALPQANFNEEQTQGETYQRVEIRIYSEP
jgi:hypothetical protein